MDIETYFSFNFLTNITSLTPLLGIYVPRANIDSPAYYPAVVKQTRQSSLSPVLYDTATTQYKTELTNTDFVGGTSIIPINYSYRSQDVLLAQEVLILRSGVFW